MKIFKSVILVTTLIWLTSCDESGESLFVFPDAPYLGITQTLEGGPEPIDNIDEADWIDIPQAGINIHPAYPNPSNGQVRLQFSISSEQIGLIYVHHPITDQIEIIADEKFLPGMYELAINFEELIFQKGIIRAYFNFGGHISYGDIFYN